MGIIIFERRWVLLQAYHISQDATNKIWLKNFFVKHIIIIIFHTVFWRIQISDQIFIYKKRLSDPDIKMNF